jgi:heme ABC exporter ATP-binding subunit CcmA
MNHPRGGTTTEKKPPAVQEGVAARTTPVISIHNARFGHAPRSVIRRVDANVLSGESVLVVGPNGAGKSTLLSTLAGLLPPLDGQVQVLGLDPLKERRRLHRNVGHLGHKDGFYPELTGRENLLLFARLHGLGPEVVDKRLQEAGLEEAADRFIREYSHGMGRRLGLARALLASPRLLILDEPDSGLDRQALQRLQTQLTTDPDLTVVMATHNPLRHLENAHRAWIIGSGRLIELSATRKGIDQQLFEKALQEVTT